MAISITLLNGTSVYQLQTSKKSILSSESSFVSSKISDNFHYCAQINKQHAGDVASQTTKIFRLSIRNDINQSETTKNGQSNHILLETVMFFFSKNFLRYALFLLDFTLSDYFLSLKTTMMNIFIQKLSFLN